MQRTLRETGRFYRGNLHTHTTVSDGRYAPERVVAHYKSRGYDFLALTDHCVYADVRGLSAPDFLVMPGMESHGRPGAGWREHHFLVLPGPRALREAATRPAFAPGERVPPLPDIGTETIRAFLDDMAARGYMTTINHPRASALEYDDILPLRGPFALEIYNHKSALECDLGTSASVWDAVLRRGMRVFGTAADDAHGHCPFESHLNDSCGGFVMVKAEALTVEAISEALYAGSFYASTGPEIVDFYIDGDTALLRCADANAIYLHDDRRLVANERLPEGRLGLRALTYRLTGKESYLRAEVVGANGGRAYANPIFLRERVPSRTKLTNT